jgi:hypothetical protein
MDEMAFNRYTRKVEALSISHSSAGVVVDGVCSRFWGHSLGGVNFAAAEPSCPSRFYQRSRRHSPMVERVDAHSNSPQRLRG